MHEPNCTGCGAYCNEPETFMTGLCCECRSQVRCKDCGVEINPVKDPSPWCSACVLNPR